MARVKRGVIARARHKKILKQAKGYYGARSRVYRVAFQAVIKAGQYAYRDRRQRKRQFRQLVDCAYQRSSTSERYFFTANSSMA
ncbi:50S ribosomal protein L20 [Escherichia coli]|uniref:50S ribosomal protein L20 n=1 Tax=Escherichia coli TaxID=562 RepID=A0A376VJP8_ECOLX|nr:50S ribosomal protein L20 [Escherichia coli]